MHNHPLALNMKIFLVEEPAQPISKLAIGKPGGGGYSGEWNTVTSLKCLLCNVQPEPTQDLAPLIDSVLLANSAMFQSAVESWELELKPCEHTLTLQQEGEKVPQKALAKCKDCDLNNNLWLCLTCGNLGCGRRQYDGSGGNNHGLEHFQTTGHPVACKLGTITPEGSASIHCYSCDEEVLDENLIDHLSFFGIMSKDLKKTEKTITEMELETNLNLTLSKAVEEGRTLTPKFGPGYTGMENLGNSCYINSVMQVLFSIDTWKERYAKDEHLKTCRSVDPSLCYFCQISKLGYGLWSGKYSEQRWSEPVETEPGKFTEPEPYQVGVKPQMFKALVGKNHPEFSTNRQQDAYEYFQHFLTTGLRFENAAGLAKEFPGNNFDFKLITKMKCLECGGSKVSSTKANSISLWIPVNDSEDSEALEVDWNKCVSTFSDPVQVEYKCPACCKTTNFTKQFMFETYPEVLVVMMNRFICPDWVPKKLECSVQVPTEPISLENLRYSKAEGESQLPEEEEPQPEINAAMLVQLVDMGFSENQAKHALVNTNNSSAEIAATWLLENIDNPEINQPLESGGAADESVSMLEAMGIPPAYAKIALSKCDGNVERAIDYYFSHQDMMQLEEESGGNSEGDSGPGDFELFGVVTHLGKSVHAGHYVAHIKKEQDWVLYNDIKVAASSDPPLGKGYIYFFKRLR